MSRKSGVGREELADGSSGWQEQVDNQKKRSKIWII